MREALVACLALAFGALALLPGTSEATHLGLQPCGDMRTRTLRITELKSNFSCRHTHETLRDLLRRGLAHLPKPTARAGHWGCGKVGSSHICTRYVSSGATPRRIVFQARRR
jgi:hypothetical protein